MFDLPIAVLVNCAAHAVSTLSLVFFIILLFGRENSLVHSWPAWRANTLKLVISVLAASHLFSVFNTQPLPASELVLNGSLAAIWLWAAVFHYQHFVKNKVFDQRD